MTAVARNHLSDEGKEAARILDLAKAGGDVPDRFHRAFGRVDLGLSGAGE